jgi:hypothetical protein
MSTDCRNSWCYFCGLKKYTCVIIFNIPLYGTYIIYHKGTAVLKNYCNIENILSYWNESCIEYTRALRTRSSRIH